MKIKLRHQQTTTIVNFEDRDSSSLTLEDLRNKITTETQISGDFQLSLNNVDVIEAVDNALLSELGIVAGDLVFIVTSGQDAILPKQASTSTDRPEGQITPANPCSYDDFSSYTADCTMSMSEVALAIKMENTATDTVNCAMPIPTDTAYENTSVAAFDPVVTKCLSEPLLCCEATSTAVPATLGHLFTVSACTSHEDALWIVVHTMMLESGYQLMQDASSESSDYLCLPDGWKNAGFYRFQYTHFHADGLMCSVTGVPMGNSLVIHGLVEGSSKFQTQQVQLKTSEFVSDDFTGAAQCYRNLDKLSRYFKDSICLPLVNAARAELGLEDSEGLLALTHELKLKIFSYLNARSLLNMDQTCRQCHAVAHDAFLWRRLYLRVFGRADDVSFSRPWYHLYKVEYKKKEERRKLMSQTTFVNPNLWDQHRFLPDFEPMHPHGIIGGDYDLNPQFYGFPDPMLIRPGQSRPMLPRPGFDPFRPSPDPFFFPRPGMPGGLPPFGGPRFF